MTTATILRGMVLTCLVVGGASARAAEPPAAQPGRAAAHAALDAMANLPPSPPSLPTLASDRARNALSDTAFAKKGATTSQAQSQAAEHAHDAVVDAHGDAATRAAQNAVAAAARAANIEVRAAAGRNQSASAKANAPGRKNNSGHP